MIEKLRLWTETSDSDCMYKLAKMYHSEDKADQYQNCLEKSATTKHFVAMKEYAAFLRSYE